jgi:hypothetical protein
LVAPYLLSNSPFSSFLSSFSAATLVFNVLNYFVREEMIDANDAIS